MGVRGPKSKIEEQRFVEGVTGTNVQEMARFHRKTKKKNQFEIFEKIAQIPLPWQQIKIRRTTFCSFCHGKLMAKKWLDSVEKQRRRIDLKDRRSVTDIQTSR